MAEQPNQSRVTKGTRDAERQDATAAHEPDRQPTPEEERLADDLELDPDAAAHYKEMAERGAHQEGEGRLP
jgi:hypothetical protein